MCGGPTSAVPCWLCPHWGTGLFGIAQGEESIHGMIDLACALPGASARSAAHRENFVERLSLARRIPATNCRSECRDFGDLQRQRPIPLEITPNRRPHKPSRLASANNVPLCSRRGNANDPNEDSTHPLGAIEPAVHGNLPDRMHTALDRCFGHVDPDRLDGVRRRHPHLGAEHSREVPRAHIALCGKVLDAKPFAQMRTNKAEQFPMNCERGQAPLPPCATRSSPRFGRCAMPQSSEQQRRFAGRTAGSVSATLCRRHGAGGQPFDDGRYRLRERIGNSLLSACARSRETYPPQALDTTISRRRATIGFYKLSRGVRTYGQLGCNREI